MTFPFPSPVAGAGKGIFAELKLLSLWYNDATAPKALIGKKGSRIVIVSVILFRGPLVRH